MYSLILFFWVVLYLPIFLLRGKFHRNFSERLGIFPAALKERCRSGSIWLHAVSVGEVRAAEPLYKTLREEFPGELIVISTVTKTGNKLAQRLKEDTDVLIYFPLDFKFIVNKTIDAIKPKLFIMTETEIWPNSIDALHKTNTPIILVNGRISPGSLRGYNIVKPFVRGTLRKINLFCMQTTGDAARIASLGADEVRIKVTGNMKFDMEIKGDLPGEKLFDEGKIFVAGSTHRPEEEIVMQVFKELRKFFPDLKLLLAPRHIERTKEVEDIVNKYGFESKRLRDRTKKADVIILDTIGQLNQLYGLADIVFVGGSLVPHGGQNLLEPAAFAKAIITGPYTFNFQDITNMFLEAKALMVVHSKDQMLEVCRRLLSDDELRKAMGERGRAVLEKNKGAAAKNLSLVREFLK